MTTASDMAPTTAAATRAEGGRLRLTHPTRGYAVTQNPFAIWEVLPVITLAFAGLAIAMTYISDAGNAEIALGAFAIVTLGMLLVPAVTLKGTFDLTHDGVAFVRGKDHFTAGWDQVKGIVNRRDAGLCLVFANPQTTRPNWRMPGGFHARADEAQLPLRYFGDRQFSILYDIRDRLPDDAWRPAVDRASRRPGWMIQADYAAIVAICCLAVYAVQLAIS